MLEYCSSTQLFELTEIFQNGMNGDSQSIVGILVYEQHTSSCSFVTKPTRQH